LDEIVDELERRIEQWGKEREEVLEVGEKFSNLIKLFKFSTQERHRLYHTRCLHENLDKYPQNVLDVTVSMNKKFSKQKEAIFVNLTELAKESMANLKLRESEEIIFSGVFLIGGEI
jgi:hypothetical protein